MATAPLWEDCIAEFLHVLATSTVVILAIRRLVPWAQYTNADRLCRLPWRRVPASSSISEVDADLLDHPVKEGTLSGVLWRLTNAWPRSYA